MIKLKKNTCNETRQLVRAIAWCKPFLRNGLRQIESLFLPYFRHFSFLSPCQLTTCGRNRSGQLVERLQTVLTQYILISSLALMLLISLVLTELCLGEEDNLHRVLKFDNKHVMLGEVTRGDVVAVSFPFVNKSDKSVRIVGISVACGCTILRDVPKQVAPYARGVISASLDTRNLNEAVQKTIEVIYSDDLEGVREQLKVSVRVFPPSDLKTDPAVLDFGDVLSGATINRSVKLLDQAQPARLTSITHVEGPAWMRFDLGKMDTRTGIQVIHATGRLPTVGGPFGGAVTLTTSEGSGHTIDLPIRGTIRSTLSSYPAAVICTVPAGGLAVGQAIIRNASGNGINHVAAVVEAKEPSLIMVEVEESRGRDAVCLTLRFRAPDSIDTIDGAIVITGMVNGRQESLRLPFLFVKSSQ